MRKILLMSMVLMLVCSLAAAGTVDNSGSSKVPLTARSAGPSVTSQGNQQAQIVKEKRTKHEADKFITGSQLPVLSDKELETLNSSVVTTFAEPKTNIDPKMERYFQDHAKAISNIVQLRAAGNAEPYNPPEIAVTYFTEDFENGGVIPDGWTDNPGTVLPWAYDGGMLGHPNPGSAHGGSYAACYNVFSDPGGGGTVDSLSSPVISLTGSGSYQLVFWSWDNADPYGYADYAEVHVKYGAGNWQYLYTVPSNSIGWIMNIIDFQTAETSMQIRFVGYSDYGYTNPYIDDIAVQDPMLYTGRCCFGQPFSPDCAVNSQQECNDLGGWSWVLDASCESNPCVAIPSNDQCEWVTPQPLGDGQTLTFTGNTTGATAINDCPAFTSYPNVWEGFTIDQCMNLTVSYCGSTNRDNIWLNLSQECPCTGFTGYSSYNNTECGDGNWTIHYSGIQPGTYFIPIMVDPANGSPEGPYTVSVTATACPPAPPNDNCADVMIDPLSVGQTLTYTGDNSGATNDCSILYWEQVWFAFSTTEELKVTIDLCGTTPPWSAIAAWLMTACPCDNYVPLTFSDFTTCGDGNGTAVWIRLPAGTYYYPLYSVAPWVGPYTLNITAEVAPPAPPNDNCANADDGGILVPGTPIQFTGTTLGASSDGNFDRPEVWVTFTLEECQNVTIDECGTNPLFDDMFIIIQPECYGNVLFASNWDNISCDGNWSLRFINLQPGQYWYPVLGSGTNNGPYVLNVTGTPCPPPPENNDCANATPIGGVVEGLPYSTTYASFDGLGLCMTSPNLWYLYTATGNGQVTASLCGSSYDTKIAVYDGPDCPVAVEPPTPIPGQGGESIAEAVPIDIATAYTGTTTGYAYDYVFYDCYNSNSPDVVYSFTAASDQTISISLCGSSYDTQLGIYDGAGNYIICNDDFCGFQSKINSFAVVAGQTYYFVVSGWNGSSGDYVISVTSLNVTLIDCNDDFCEGQSQIDFTAVAGHQYLIEVGGFSNRTGDGVLTISVQGGGGCAYIPGDINGNGVANGIDVIYGVSFFKGGPVPPVDCFPVCPTLPNPFYGAGDVNGSCLFNGIDITYFVAYLKGSQPALNSCPACPPVLLERPAVQQPVVPSRLAE